jgi:hypothetical protein
MIIPLVLQVIPNVRLLLSFGSQHLCSNRIYEMLPLGKSMTQIVVIVSKVKQQMTMTIKTNTPAEA